MSWGPAWVILGQPGLGGVRRERQAGYLRNWALAAALAADLAAAGAPTPRGERGRSETSTIEDSEAPQAH